jgi:tetratricopeptide (TPR) repeat protein
MVDEIEHLITSGRFFEAHNMAQAYCAKHPDDLRALQLCGLAMSKSGARNAAINFLEPVLEKNAADVETAGILGGVYKEQFKMTAESVYARKSHETYLSNFETTQSYYTGINAATMSQILGWGKAAREVAKQVVDLASEEDDFWSYATVGEAYLLLRDPVKAKEYYGKAAALGDKQYGYLGSVYGQLLILKHYINVPESILAQFAPPKIAVFAGHMIDNNRKEPRFPEYISNNVKEAIKETLVKNKIRIGYSSLACGSDILFVEALLELDGEANIFMPFNRTDFIRESIAFAGGDWLQRFEKIESSQKVLYISKSNYDGNDILFNFLGKILIGAGVMRASLFHDKPFLVTVASENDMTMKEGGTNSVRALWPYEQSMVNINSDLFLKEDAQGYTDTPAAVNEIDHVGGGDKNIQYFALATLVDDKEHSREVFNEVIEKVKAEFIEFPGPRRSSISEHSLYAFYSKAHYAMDFALRLLEWSHQAGLEVRVALEAVLMKKGSNPHKVIKETSNLKSLAFNDACYATMQFAAALSAEQPGRYDFHHVGIINTGAVDEGQEIYKIDQKVETALS